jgi:uncharacterized membrane protein (UPF0127 family)
VGEPDAQVAPADESGTHDAASPEESGSTVGSIAEPGPDATAPTGIRPVGFPVVGVRVTDTAGDVCEVCMWLADSAELRGRGLMGVTDLGGAVGMVFVFDRPSTGAFFMYRTPTPLDIHWIDPDGIAVATAAMDPCLDTASGDCPRYRPGEEYLTAVETFRGGADDIGLTIGATVELIDAGTACADVLDAAP